VKGEAAALSVRAQRCQSHYFSTTPRIILIQVITSRTVNPSLSYGSSFYYLILYYYDSICNIDYINMLLTLKVIALIECIVTGM